MRISLGLKILGGNALFIISLALTCWHATEPNEMILGAAVIGALIALVVNFIVYRNMISSINSMTDTVDAIARGDLGRAVLVQG